MCSYVYMNSFIEKQKSLDKNIEFLTTFSLPQRALMSQLEVA